MFAKQEVRKDRVTAFAYNLPAGSSSFSYKALVVTPGEFALPPTKAFAQAQPELLGLSGGGKWGSQDVAWTNIDVARTGKLFLFRDFILLLEIINFIFFLQLAFVSVILFCCSMAARSPSCCLQRRRRRHAALRSKIRSTWRRRVACRRAPLSPSCSRCSSSPHSPCLVS